MQAALLNINIMISIIIESFIEIYFNMPIQLRCNYPSTESFLMILISLESENPTLQIQLQNMPNDELHPNLHSNNVHIVFRLNSLELFVTMSTASHNNDTSAHIVPLNDRIR